MAKDLFKGHSYSFKKEGSDLVLLNSSDHSHEQITFREGMVVSGSGITIKCDTSGKGIIGLAHNETDTTFRILSNNDDGYLELYANNKTNFRVENDDFQSRQLNHKLGYMVGTVSSAAPNGGYVNLELGRARGDNGGAYIDLIGDTTYTDFGDRWIRKDTGANAETDFHHRGTGQLRFFNDEDADMKMQIGNAHMDHYANAASKHPFTFHNDGNNTNRYGLSISTGTDDGAGTNYYIYFRDGNGSHIGSMRGINGAVTLYAFTGAHNAKMLQSDSPSADIIETGASDDTHYPLGTIMVNVKSEVTNLSGSTDPCLQPSSYVVTSSLHQDKRALGVYFGNGNDEERPHYHSVAALGDGVILVCPQNGNIENGDYITTASGSGGYGCKQNDDILHNYTVAKSLTDVDWSTESSSSKLIACTYHCG